jgi:hypothetical protein
MSYKVPLYCTRFYFFVIDFCKSRIHKYKKLRPLGYEKQKSLPPEDLYIPGEGEESSNYRLAAQALNQREYSPNKRLIS